MYKGNQAIVVLFRKWSTIKGNGKLYSGNNIKTVNLFSGQDKPFISDGFEAQTIHSQPIWFQAVIRISAGLKGFAGKIMRNAREETYFSPFQGVAKGLLKTNVCARRAQNRTVQAMPSSKSRIISLFNKEKSQNPAYTHYLWVPLQGNI